MLAGIAGYRAITDDHAVTRGNTWADVVAECGDAPIVQAAETVYITVRTMRSSEPEWVTGTSCHALN